MASKIKVDTLETANGSGSITLNNPIAGFTSTGIDDNATSTAVTIDASENVLLGKTSQDSSLSGCELLNNGTAQFTRDGNSGLRINRLTSDGELLRLSKDGTTVGSIISDSGSIMLGSGDVGVYFDAASDRILPMNITTGSVRNDAIDIGGNPHRFKDLYLSGGVYLGGTGAANKLDDYEEGTFSATVGTGTATYLYGEYVKVGSSVTASCLVYNFSNITSTGDQITLALPFASNSSSGFGGAGNVMFRYISGVDDVTVSPHIGVNSSILEFFQCNSQNYVTLKHSQLGNSSSRIYFTVTYKTDA